MRRPILSVALLLAALGGLLLLVFPALDSVGTDGAGVRPKTDHQSVALEEPLTAPDPEFEVTAEIGPDQREAADTVPPLDVEETAADSRSRVIGKVTDMRGTPLQGVRVVMAPPHFWSRTDSEGAFEFDTPLPTSDWVSLAVSPSDFFMSAGIDFGHAGGRDREPLRPGENDLGTLVLADAGAFEGRVEDTQGAPIAGAYITLSVPGSYSGSATAGKDGKYRVGHVPEGKYSAEAYREGYVAEEKSIVVVKNGEVTPRIDFQLERSPSISGRVMDADGQPLRNVRLDGWPSSGGRGAHAQTAADGTFTAYLPQDESYTLSAQLAGYETFETGYRSYIEPGATDIEIVLRRPKLTTYIVLDEASGEPIERFGLKVIRVRTEDGITTFGNDRVAAAIADHPGGEVVLPGNPCCHNYTIVAPGYGPKRGRIKHDDEGAARQTIRLTPAGALIARFVFAGERLPYPTLRIQADLLTPKPGEEAGKKDLDWFAGARRRHSGDAGGIFRIEDLAPGTYRLDLSAKGVAPLIVKGVRVESGRTTELGDLEAMPPSEIHGTVLLPGGLSPAGLGLELRNGSRKETQVTDPTGQFTFKGLAEGKHYLHFKERYGILLKGVIELDVGPGEVKTVPLDLGEFVPCEVRVHVRVAGKAAEGVTVRARPSKGWRGKVCFLGATNEAGVVAGLVKGHSDLVFEVKGSGGLMVGVSEASDLPAGGRELIDLDFDAGRLTVTLGRLSVTLADEVSYASLMILRADAKGRWATTLPPAEWRLVGGELRADLGWVTPSDYTVRLNLGGKLFEGQVMVTKGESALCKLEPDGG